MGVAILKLDKDRKLLNADVSWVYPVDLKSVEPVQKHIVYVSLESAHVTSEHFSFLLPAFESGPPVIGIISLYLWYQVYFVIIIVEFLVTVLSITFFFWILRADCPFK